MIELSFFLTFFFIAWVEWSRVRPLFVVGGVVVAVGGVDGCGLVG